MWCLDKIDDGYEGCFTDGQPLHAMRNGHGLVSRLAIKHQGFLDITEVQVSGLTFIVVNESWVGPFKDRDAASPLLKLQVEIVGDKIFNVTTIPSPDVINIDPPRMVASGNFTPFPSIDPKDVEFLRTMHAQKFIPYPPQPGSDLGLTEEEIRRRGRILFPFSQHSFYLALCVYDWTTASFTRMVFFKIFEYTGIPKNPFPLDMPQIARQIWNSDWPPYTPRDRDYMNSFMMKPANSLESVQQQLDAVVPQLHMFSNVQNRVFKAAMQSLPRTSVLRKPRLFSGQVDIRQLGLDHFGIGFLECPLNTGPVNHSLTIELAAAMNSYISRGHTITTKMVCSFTDNKQDAMHYSNGILIVANRPHSMFWDTAAYVTPLSDDPKKTEYTFMPGSPFLVENIHTIKIAGKDVFVITLRPLPRRDSLLAQDGEIHSNGAMCDESELDVAALAESYSSILEEQIQLFDASEFEGDVPPGVLELPRKHPSKTHFKLAHRTNGAYCACMDALDRILDEARSVVLP
ncbi:hypothetical protein DL96DRAFT_1460350 [Flagelloscypha sp. PMI_526]|nr:hypothetical protein DL96DRAFT_1460350 [Flagelloscypha sp. PMI_526]